MSLVMSQLVAHAKCEHWKGFKYIGFPDFVVFSLTVVLSSVYLGIQA